MNFSSIIEEAHLKLKIGDLVIIPTETVYGLGADASNIQAVQKIFALKGRPADHPVIVHIKDQTQLTHWAREIPPLAYQLTNAFWPGPLTLILKKQPWVADIVTGGQDTVGLRAPNHPFTQALLERFSGGIAAPSANRFGHISPTTPSHVKAEFKEHTPFIIDGGAATIGLESTIVSLVEDRPVLLRPGGISVSQIEEVLNGSLLYPVNTMPKIRVSGALDAHYAPTTPLILGDLTQIVEEISFFQQEKIVLIHHSHRPTFAPPFMKYLSLPSLDVKAYAHLLYHTLREADAYQAKRIFMERPPEGMEWMAIHDRLQRAAHTIIP